MPAYRRRPTTVDALQWTGDNTDDATTFCGGPRWFSPVRPEDRTEDPDITAEVFDDVIHNIWIPVRNGQWIIRGTKGELYPCADDVFTATYEPIA